MVPTRGMKRKSEGALCGDFVPQKRSRTLGVREVHGGAVLGDAIDVVVKFLNMRDLHAVSQVCTLWNAAAAREVTKRRQIQRLLIPHTESVYHIPSALHVTPCVALLFVASKTIEESQLRRSNCPTHKHQPSSSARTVVLSRDRNSQNRFLSSVFNAYKRQLPHNLVGMEVGEFFIDKDIVMPKDLKKQVDLETAGSQSILGLFLPSGRGMSVRVTWCDGLTDHLPNVADRMIDQLMISEELPQSHGSAMLVFAQSLTGYFLAEQVIFNMQKRYPNRADDHVWGGLVGNELGATNCHENDLSSGSKKIFVGLRITGPGLQTWMIIIDCTSTRDEIARRLHEFKEKVHPKRHTMGLAYGPTHIQPRGRNDGSLYHDAQDIMKAIKSVFIDIQFTGIFNRDTKYLISCNAIDEGMSRKMQRDKFMTLFVIAYD